jgi:hypothetical protein
VIRWREIEIAPDGTQRTVQCYDALGEQRRASLDYSSLRGVWHRAGELVDIATYLLVLGAREGRPGKVIAHLFFVPNENRLMSLGTKK